MSSLAERILAEYMIVEQGGTFGDSDAPARGRCKFCGFGWTANCTVEDDGQTYQEYCAVPPEQEHHKSDCLVLQARKEAGL